MNKIQKGFTLIELLVVIAVLGILATAVLVAINPLQKINQANDSKVKNDIGQMANAVQSYYTIHQYYPNSLTDLTASNELTAVPAVPTGYTAYTISAAPAGCTTALKTCTSVALGGQIKAPATTGNTLWCYKTSSGLAAEGTTCTAP